MIQYLDKKGRLLFVAEGIWFAQPEFKTGNYGTFYRKGNGRGMHRFVSPSLPMRKTRTQAEDDLTWYALDHDLVPVTISHQE
jgi:hypothetical protein